MIRWGLYQDKGKWVIRRGKERLPVKRYQTLRGNEDELKKFVIRLNAPIDAKKRVIIKHAFISPEMLDEYKEYLLAQIPSARNALCEFNYLENYFLNFFIGKLNLENPLDWHSVHETKWATYLCSKDVPSSTKSKRAIIQAANRFMHWLHRKRPAEVPSLNFTPLSRAKFKEIEARREMQGEVHDRKIINPAHWKIIKREIRETSIAPFVLIAYHYGLRRAEVLGVSPGDTKKGHLVVTRQLSRYNETPKFSPLKGRSSRKVPHWFCNASDVYTWIQDAQNKLMHPDTLTDRWNELMDTLELDYDFHDLRHTFITYASRTYKADILAVRDAAGHKDVKTTQKYLHDLPSEDDDIFIPEAG